MHPLQRGFPDILPTLMEHFMENLIKIYILWHENSFICMVRIEIGL